MNVLLITQRHRYFNPTRESLVNEFKKLPNITLSGIKLENNSRNITKLAKKYGKFDVIIAEPWAFVSESITTVYEERPVDLLEYGAPIISFMIQFDFHNIKQEVMRDILEKSQYCISSVLSKQFRFIPADKTFSREPWLDENAAVYSDPGIVTDNMLMLPHCIAEEEFVYQKKDPNKHDLTIVGTEYFLRKMVRQYFEESQNISFKNGNDAVQRLVNKFVQKKILGKYYPFMNISRRRFREIIASSLTCYTCDAGIGYAVRKYFEIPALGTILFGNFFRGLEYLGFKDQENCFFFREADIQRMEEILVWLKSDSIKAKSVAKAGQDFIRQYHTARIRASQLYDIVEAVANGTLRTTRWENGQQKLVHYEEKTGASLA